MSKKLRVFFLILLIALSFSLLFTTRIIAQESIKLVFALMVAEDYPFSEGARYFAKEVEERTDGRVEIDLFYGGVLGSESDQFESIQEGLIDFMVISPGYISEFIPEYGIFDLPYLFANLEHRNKVAQSETMERMNKILEEKANVLSLGSFGGSTRNLITTEKPVTTIEDMKGIQMRTWASPMISETWTSLGAMTTIVAYSEVYTALQSGLVEAAENEYPTFVMEKWYEPCKYVTRTVHGITIRPFLTSTEKFYSLPDDIQQIILEAGKEATLFENKVEAENELEYENEMKEYGITFLDLKDRQKWIEATEDVRVGYSEDLGMTELYLEIKKLAE